jgi:molybdenum cofactor cytidylyltransferase
MRDPAARHTSSRGRRAPLGVIAGLLLAAGGARRFGSQKLVAPLDGSTIVKRAAETLAAASDELWVVVGSDSDAVRRALDGVAAHIVENEDWRQGLSSSLAAGIRAIRPEVDAIVIGLGDQPSVDPQIIRQVIARWRETARPIISARYRGIRGHPVLLAREVFEEASGVSGDVGARDLIAREPARVAFVDVNTDPPRDVDTRDDLSAFQG